MAVEFDVSPAGDYQDDESSVEQGDEAPIPNRTLALALVYLAIGLDVSGLSDEDVESLRFVDRVYLVKLENIRRLSAIVDFLKSLRGNHNLVTKDDARKARGGRLGKVLNNRTHLMSDEEYVV